MIEHGLKNKDKDVLSCTGPPVLGKKAFKTTIPAQIVKKFNCEIVPVYIQRYEKFKFKISVERPIKFDQYSDQEIITEELNKVLEKMVLNDPSQWILTHNRWK